MFTFTNNVISISLNDPTNREENGKDKIKSNVVRTAQVATHPFPFLTLKKKDTAMTEHLVLDLNVVLDLSTLTLKDQSQCTVPHSDTRENFFFKKNMSTGVVFDTV